MSSTAIHAPVKEPGTRSSQLVEIKRFVPDAHLDIRYATKNNFVGRKLYSRAEAYLQLPAAQSLARVARRLRKRGYGLLIYDGYRPWSVSLQLYQLTPPDKRQYVAYPGRGSRHNRGCAVDLSLYSLRTGRPVAMPSDFDETTPRAHTNYSGGDRNARRRRDLLRKMMEAEGWFGYSEEWWHFNYPEWKRYPVLNILFERLRSRPIKPKIDSHK